jgi:hypothetical protein
MTLQFCGDVLVELKNILGNVDYSLLVTESQSSGTFCCLHHQVKVNPPPPFL